MARKVLIQIRRGLETNIGTLADGELGYCEDTRKLYIGTNNGNVLLVASQTVGDMLKSIYDTNNNGKVDRAENADKVNGFTVLTAVPANAKFTDTTYAEITNAEIDAGTSSTLRAMTGRRVKYILDKVVSLISAITKADIGLGNVPNYGVASQAQAEAGTANNLFMTPLRVTQATAELRNEIVGLQSNKVDNSRVLTDVPTNAKFTDTIYTHPSTHPASIITESTTKRFVTDAQISSWTAKGSSNLALGETSSTAYRGDRGKTAYDHSQSAHAPSNAQKNSDITKSEIEAKLTGTITSHAHIVAKGDVGLGSVQNYGVATQAQAESGTANNVYMTPIRVKQAIDKANSIPLTWNDLMGV